MMELVVSELAVARGGIAVLSGVSFSVPAGRALVLRGPNGLGKTTLLRTIAGLQPPLAGRIIPGPDQVAYAGHADAVKSALTVGENLTLWASVYGAPGIDAALAGMELRLLRDRPAQNLSAGQKRRLGLARLLLSDRTVWALDEPTVSLDSDMVRLFTGLLARHLARGGIGLLATHVAIDLPDAAMLDLTPFRATTTTQATTPHGAAGFDEAFL